MIWNGIDGLGSGTVALKILFILVATVMFWAVCELVKYLAGISVKLAEDALRSLTIKVRGKPIEKAGVKKDTVPIYRVHR
jgi:hypothetical protein